MIYIYIYCIVIFSISIVIFSIYASVTRLICDRLVIDRSCERRIISRFSNRPMWWRVYGRTLLNLSLGNYRDFTMRTSAGRAHPWMKWRNIADPIHSLPGRLFTFSPASSRPPPPLPVDRRSNFVNVNHTFIRTVHAHVYAARPRISLVNENADDNDNAGRAAGHVDDKRKSRPSSLSRGQ